MFSVRQNFTRQCGHESQVPEVPDILLQNERRMEGRPVAIMVLVVGPLVYKVVRDRPALMFDEALEGANGIFDIKISL